MEADEKKGFDWYANLQITSEIMRGLNLYNSTVLI